MSKHQNISGDISEHFLSPREKSLQNKVVHLETQLQVFKSQIDILHEERKKLEERVLTMESALAKTRRKLLETKKEVLDKELAEIQLSEKLRSLNLQVEEYKRLFLAEKNKNTGGIDRLKVLISNVDAQMHNEDVPNRFESLKDLISVIQEGFQAHIKMILDKLSDAEDKLCGSSMYTEGKVPETKNSKEQASHCSIFEVPNPNDKVKLQVDRDLLGKSKGSWECDTCMVSNSSDALVCEACTSKKPGVQTSQMPTNRGTMLKNQTLKPTVQKESVNTEKMKEELAKFKAEEGSWECDTCMVNNSSDKLVCVACTTPKPGVQTSQVPANQETMLKNQASLKPLLQKEAVNTEGVKDLFAKFKAEEGSWECDTCIVRNGSDKLVCVACTTPKPGAQTSQMPANRGTPSFSFGTAGASSNSGFSFGSTAYSVDAGSGSTPASSQGFSFASNSSSFGTGFVFGQQKAKNPAFDDEGSK